jgi:hypothetical protein
MSQTGDWGEPVEGVQMRLAVSKAAVPRPGELPQFEFQLRNTGKETVIISLDLSTIEIDGLTYGRSSNLFRQTLAPGAETGVAPISFGTPLYELNDIGGLVRNCRLQLRPGKHTVQVNASGGISLQDQGNSRAGFSVTYQSGLLKSNTITIDIPRASTSEGSGPQSPCAPRA